MSLIEDVAKYVGSLRYARDLIAAGGDTQTTPWWVLPRPDVAALIVACATGDDPEYERVIPHTNSGERNV